MKKYAITFLALLLCVSVYGQTNTFPSSGNVGIGTASPPGNYKLYIKQANSAPQYGIRLINSSGTKSLQLWTGTGSAVIDAEGTSNLMLMTAGLNRIFISNDGKIGVGTTSPNSVLDIRSDGSPIGVSTLAVNNTFATSSDDYAQNRPFTIRRGASNNEALFSFLQDVHLNFVYQNDENYSQIHYRIINTDTETGGGENSNDNIVMSLFGNSGGSGVCIGTSEYNGAYKLSVGGVIRASEVKVQNVPQSDYVFEPDYPLLPLAEVESYIKENKHLPDIPSAKEFKQNGVGLGEMDDMLLRKIEELTLYMIEQEKKHQALRNELYEKINELESKLNQ